MERGLENLRDFAGRLRRVVEPGSNPKPRETAEPVDPKCRAARPESRTQRPTPFG
jgi:hypothetical protein